MNSYNSLFDSEWIQALGWTLLNSLWQGATIALLFAFVLLMFRKLPANMKYLLGVGALSGLLISMVITFNLIYNPTPETALSDDPDKSSYYANNQSNDSSLNLDLYQPINEETSMFSVCVTYFETHMPFILLIYMIGVLILTMRMLGELVYIQNLRYSRSHFAPKVWQEKLEQMALKMGIKADVALKESLQVNSPMIIGFLKPIIFIPIGLLANLPTNQIESILAHELAHIRRHDYLINLMQSFVEILLFFNPAVWWISSFIRSERENCCDDIAIELTGDELTLARTLAKLEEWRMQNSRLAVAFAGNRGVLGRIQRLLEKKESIQLPFRLFWGATILSVGLLFAAFNDVSFSKNSLEIANSESIDAIDFDNSASTATFEESLTNPPENRESFHYDNLEQNFNTDNENAFANPFTNFERTPIHEFALTTGDTLPEKIKTLEKEMREMEKSFELKRQSIANQMRELEIKRHAIEKEAQAKEFALQSANLEIQREIQTIEREKMMMERELDLRFNAQQQTLLELQYKMQAMELQLDNNRENLSEDEKNEKLKTEIDKNRKEIQELKKAIMLQEQDLMKNELDVKKQAILKEKEIQEKMYQNQLKEYETQTDSHSMEAEMLKLEISMQQLEFQLEGLENEFHDQLQKLEYQIQIEYQKMEENEF